MAKFYCQSGSFQTIVDAIDYDEAARKTIQRLIRTEAYHDFFLRVSEQGFNHLEGSMTCSLIPFMRELGADLPPDDVLVANICASLGITSISEEDRHWLLYGETTE